jgi:hypothetical protein
MTWGLLFSKLSLAARDGHGMKELTAGEVQMVHQLVNNGESMKRPVLCDIRDLMLSPRWMRRRTFSEPEAYIDMLFLGYDPDGSDLSPRREIAVSLGSLGHRWRWSKMKVGRWLFKLQEEGLIVTESDTRKTVVTFTRKGSSQTSVLASVTARATKTRVRARTRSMRGGTHRWLVIVRVSEEPQGRM